MKIRALKAFTIRDSETGNLTSIANGEIAEVSDTLGSSLISDGLAEAYTLITPTGSIEIFINGVPWNVRDYATADVDIRDFSLLVNRSIESITEEMWSKKVTFQEIGSYAFYACDKLASVIIPSYVYRISDHAFEGCTKLTSLTVLATTPPAFGTNTLLHTPENLKIYVPSASVGEYQAASGWSDYEGKIQAIPG